MAKFRKRYGLFAIVEEKLYGYVEHSFSMSWEPDEVRQFDNEDATYNFNILKKKYPTANIFIARISGNFPKSFQTKMGKKVEILWKDRQNKLYSPKCTKYDYRNVKFRIVEK